MRFTQVDASQRDRAVATLVMAFASDPFVRWIYPEAEPDLNHFPEVLLAFGGIAFTENTVWRLGDFAAVALWMRPGIEPDGKPPWRPSMPRLSRRS